MNNKTDTGGIAAGARLMLASLIRHHKGRVNHKNHFQPSHAVRRMTPLIMLSSQVGASQTDTPPLLHIRHMYIH